MLQEKKMYIYISKIEKYIYIYIDVGIFTNS